MSEELLIEAAKNAMKNAYAKYSNFNVGAAALFEDGKIYVGCNVENKSYGLTICAERVAATAAIVAGNRKLAKIAVVGNTEQPITPCGACREFLAEFSDLETEVIMTNLKGEVKKIKMFELLPMGFELK